MTMPLQKKKHALVLVAVLGSIAAVACTPDPVEEEERGETTSAILDGRVVSEAEVADHIRQAGFPESMVGTMTCVAKWESSFYERARNGRHLGLFQISTLHLGTMRGCPATEEAVYPAAANARCAFAVYSAQGIGAWTAYSAHRAECDRYPAPKASSVPPSRTGAREARPPEGSGPSCGELVDALSKARGKRLTGLCEQHDVQQPYTRTACGGNGRVTWDCDACCYIVAPKVTAPL